MQFHKEANNILVWISLLSILFMSSFDVVFAECELDKWPAKELQTYIKELDKELTAIRTEVGKTSCGPGEWESSLSRMWTELLKTYNMSTNFSNFGTSFGFWIKMILKTEVPPPIMRDYRLVRSQTKKIQQTADYAYKNCITSWPEKRLQDALAKQIKIEQTFVSVVGSDDNDWDDFRSENIFPWGTLKEDELLNSLIDNYKKEAFQSCVNNGEFAISISKLSKDIWLTQESFEKWLEDWQKAAQLLLWEHPKQDEIEKNLLRKELAKQGVGAEASAAMVNKLRKGSGTPGNGISGVLDAIGSRITTTGGWFKWLYEQIKKDIFDPETTSNTNIFSEKLNKNQNINAIEKEISADYGLTKELIWNESNTFTTNIGNLADLHVAITMAIKKVKNTIEKSEKICESQGKWLWICKYR